MAMKPLELRQLRNDDEFSFLNTLHEFKTLDPNSIEIFAFQYEPEIPFREYVEMVNSWPEGKNLPETFVPNTFYIGVVEGKIVGRLSFRHRLNDFLERIAGHMGYCVTPSQRNHGYATQMLKEALLFAREQGLDRVLLTCDTDNIGSIRVIEKNGGVFKDTTNEPELSTQKHRYWIQLTDKK